MGTHFIKSAKFGGELEIRKTMDAKQAGTKTQFSQQMNLSTKAYLPVLAPNTRTKEERRSGGGGGGLPCGTDGDARRKFWI